MFVTMGQNAITCFISWSLFDTRPSIVSDVVLICTQFHTISIVAFSRIFFMFVKLCISKPSFHYIWNMQDHISGPVLKFICRAERPHMARPDGVGLCNTWASSTWLSSVQSTSWAPRASNYEFSSCAMCQQWCSLLWLWPTSISMLHAYASSSSSSSSAFAYSYVYKSVQA